MTVQPKKPCTPFISELAMQIRYIDERLQELRNRGVEDVFGTVKLRPEDREEFKALRLRRKEIREQLITAKH